MYFQKIREEVRWCDVLETLGIKINKKRKSYSFRTGEYIILCPFHREKKPSMHLFVNGRYHCYGCGEGGDIFDFVSRCVFDGNKIKTYGWFKKNFRIPPPWCR